MMLNKPIKLKTQIMFLATLLTITFFGVSLINAEQIIVAEQKQNTSNSIKLGTKQNPVAIDLVATEKSPTEAEQEAQDRFERNKADSWLIDIGIVQGAIFFLQLIVFGYQALKLRQTVKAADGQTKHLQQSISEASRSAAAMEHVAKSIAISAEAATESVANTKEISSRQKLAMETQLRAYLTVVIGAEAWYQERNKNIKFEAKPLVVNTGHTPAREVTYRIKADILPISLSSDFIFSLPDDVKGGSVIGPHQNATLNGGILDGFVNDDDVKDIKYGTGQKVLYVWGIVNYVDIFKEKRETKFGQIIYWRQADDKVNGLYTRQNNAAT